MPADPDLLARSVELKQQLVEYAQSEQFADALAAFRAEQFGAGDAAPSSGEERSQADDDRAANVLDAFILQRQLPDGQTVVERFITAHPDLPEAERELLLGWRDVVQGIFAVQKREGDALLVDNLIDELMYRVHSPEGRAAFAQLAGGSFLVARLVPIGDEWLISGAHTVMPWISASIAYRMAADLAVANPALVFRNPANLARAWKIQAGDRASFIDFFGADQIVVPGAELEGRMREYAHYQMHVAKDEEGKTVAERAMRVYGAVPEPPDPDLPEGIDDAETVGVIFDEVDGLKFLPNYQRVQDAFADPELLADDRYREVVRHYFDDPAVSPRVLERLATGDPARASQVVQRVLERPEFDWAEQGEALLHELKASYYASPVLPGVTPLGEELARARIAGATGLVASAKQAAQQRVRNASRRRKRK